MVRSVAVADISVPCVSLLSSRGAVGREKEKGASGRCGVTASCGRREDSDELMATWFAPRSPTTRLSGYRDNPYIFLDDTSIHSCLHAGQTVHHSDRLWTCRKTDPDDPQLSSTRFRFAYDAHEGPVAIAGPQPKSRTHTDGRTTGA